MFENENDIDIIPSISDDYKTGIITITNSKTIESDPNIEEIEIIDEEGIEEKNTKIVIEYNLDDFLYDKYFKIKNVDFGIKIIYLKIKIKEKKIEEIKKKNN